MCVREYAHHIHVTEKICLSPVTRTADILVHILSKSTILLLNTAIAICFHSGPPCIQLSTSLRSSNSCFQLLFSAGNYWQPFVICGYLG